MTNAWGMSQRLLNHSKAKGIDQFLQADLVEAASMLMAVPPDARRLLDRCRHEIKNLLDKLAKKEMPGWEGEQRRGLLLSDLNKALS